jgi:SecD/SecF fusion protein
VESTTGKLLTPEPTIQVTYETVKENPTDQEMEETIQRLEKRVEQMIVNSDNASVERDGENRIVTTFLEFDNSEEVINEIGKVGMVEFIDPYEKTVLDGTHIESAEALQQKNLSTGMDDIVIVMKLDETGTKIFADVTKELEGKALGIYYDGKEISSPTIESAILDGIAYISGGFNELKEAQIMAAMLNSGALPIELKKVDQKSES